VLVVTFPGQGSQRPGMGQAWTGHPSWELVMDTSDVSGRDVAGLLLESDAEELTATRNAQLATFTLSLVVLDALERLGLEPQACAGHSLGEYTALVAAGALSFEEGVQLVTERGNAMQAAADQRPGTMAVLTGADDDLADAACQRAEAEVWVANYNAPGQVVIAGTTEAVARAAEIARELGARKALPIPVGGAFHTPLMAPARDRLRKTLSAVTFSDPDVPVFANVDARPHLDATDWPGLLSAQLCSPVRWHQTLGALSALDPDQPLELVEAGPGGVLTGLAKRSLPEARTATVATPSDLDTLVERLTFGQGHPAVSGEHLHVAERLVVSPATGLFQPDPLAAAVPGPGGASFGAPDPLAASAAHLDVGARLGRVGDAEVRSAFSGALMQILAFPGERVARGQPVAWLRADPQ
jgi:[acyl-carrier-protein] S-malonyltransferase